MTTLKLQGDGAGGGSITISPTNTSSNRTVTLPDADVTVPSGLPDAQAKFSSNVLTAEGDILYASAANTLARLAHGTAGQILAVNDGLTAPVWVDNVGREYAILEQVETSGTSGGSVTIDAWVVRPINTETDPFSLVDSFDAAGAATAEGQFRLVAGTYLIKWWAATTDVGNHKTRLALRADSTGSTDSTYQGSSEYTHRTHRESSNSRGSARVVTNGTQVLELQHWLNNNPDSDTNHDFGSSVSIDSTTETFCVIEIYREV